MSSSTWVNYGIGIVVGVAVGVFTAGTGLAAYAAFAGLTAGSITASYLNGRYAGPKMPGLRPPSGFGNAGGQTGMKDAAAASMQINSASESVMAPVVFGLCRISGNITRYDLNTFRSVPIIERTQRDPGQVAYEMAKRAYARNPSKVNHQIDSAAAKQQAASGTGGKGGSDSSSPPSQTYSGAEKIQAYTQILMENSNGGKKLPKEYDEYIVGYNYFLTWELGICMGPVDYLAGVRCYPGEFVVAAPGAIVADETVFAGAGGEQGGAIRFYRGSSTQTRNVADPYANAASNYRHVCFAVFQDYLMGKSPGPSSYAFEIGRWPVCIDADGNPLAGMKVRASANPASQAYFDANPAAILWEIFTNRIWGKGLDPAKLDAASFIAASEYFEDEELGMSFSMEGQTLVNEAVETIRSHVNTTVVWQGDKLYCVCLMDRSRAYSPMVVITSDNVSNASVSRPAWPSTSNEVRGTFLNRLNNYQSEIAMAQDIANIATVGRINSTTIDLPAFSTRVVCEKAIRRMLGETSYPQATLKFKMNRFESRLVPGGFFAFIWNEWSAGTITSYWRVTDMNDADQDNGGIDVTAAEDLYATAQIGALTTFTPPVAAFEGVTVNEDSDLYLGDDHAGAFDAGAFTFQVVEMPIALTDGDRILSFFTQRQNGQTKELAVHWRETGSGDDWKSLGIISPWATTGQLVADVPATTGHTRNADWEIELDLPSERAFFLELCSVAPTISDHLDAITGSETNMARVGNEIMQIAQAEAGSTAARVKVKAAIRGQFGTNVEAHTAGAKVAFVYEFVPYSMTLRHDEIPLGVSIDFQATPFDRFGIDDTAVLTTLTLTNRARKALAVETWEASAVGLDYSVSFRPRFHNRGQDAIADLEGSLNALTGAIPTGYAFYVMPQDGAEADLLAEAVAVVGTLIPDDGNTAAAGLVEFDYTAPVGTTSLLLMQSWDGVLGYPTRITP